MHEQKKEAAYKKRMEEIRKEKEKRFARDQAAAEAKRKRQRQEEEERQKRKQDKQERERIFKKAQEEEARLDELRRIVRLKELRTMKSR